MYHPINQTHKTVFVESNGVDDGAEVVYYTGE